MKKFLIQSKNEPLRPHDKLTFESPAFDFCFHLIEAVEYQNWYHNENVYRFNLIRNKNQIRRYYQDGKWFNEDWNENIPVGSVEFVLDFYKEYYKIENIKPINIPEDLMQRNYLKRCLYRSNFKDISNSFPKPVFIKSTDKIKGFNIITKYKHELPSEGNCLVSELIDIESEWRSFVFNGKLLDIRCYSGDFELFPDIRLVKYMINRYKNSPRAYTIDVGVNKDKDTFLIEVHQFFSCGLYGFTDYRVLPQMFVSCHREIIDRKLFA